MKTILILLSFVVLFGLFPGTGCVWENDEDILIETGFCDTASVSFREDIVPILSANCYNCHSNSNAPVFANGIVLEDYQDVAGVTGRIIGAVNHRNGFYPMPPGGEKLDDCSIEKIEAWSNSGAPDN
jgi:hypothetical protein